MPSTKAYFWRPRKPKIHQPAQSVRESGGGMEGGEHEILKKRKKKNEREREKLGLCERPRRGLRGKGEEER